VVQWVGPFVIGIYVGILIDPWFRAWIAQNEWARQLQESEDPEPQDLSGEISWQDYEWLTEQPPDAPSEGALRDKPS
jgi:hypothetical protein